MRGYKRTSDHDQYHPYSITARVIIPFLQQFHNKCRYPQHPCLSL